MARKITQREARDAIRRVRILEARIKAMTGRSGGGYLVSLGSLDIPASSLRGAIWAAERLGHAVIARVDGNVVKFEALPEVGL